MEYPEIPTENTPAIQSVAGSRKFNVRPFQSDGFTSAVNAQRPGSGAPGLCGLGLTRDKTKFTYDNLGAPMSSHLSPSSSKTEQSMSSAELAEEQTDDFSKNGIAGMMFKAAGVQLLSGSMKEEEVWRQLFRNCCSSSLLSVESPDPFEDPQAPPLAGKTLCDKICGCEENNESDKAIWDQIQSSPALRALRDQPALQDALIAINEGQLSGQEWVHFCDAVRDIVKWNEFNM